MAQIGTIVIIICCIFCDIFLCQFQESFASRYGRFLSLFTVVKFANEGCMTTSGENGTCLASSQCQQRGGTPSGPCANGYGICCIFVATCGGTIRDNQTYFVNHGYPNQFDGTGSCQLTVLKSNLNICQIRYSCLSGYEIK